METPQVSDERPDGKPGRRTLGDLLYTDTSRAPVSEKEWVDLVAHVAAGDQRALQTLYERTHRIVFTLIVRITHNQQTAEELTLDVFHDVWRRASIYDPAGGTVVGWIMNQARSRAIDRLRFEQRKKRLTQSGDVPPVEMEPRDPLAACDLHERGRVLREALAVLTPEERRAIEAAYFSELTYSQVAERLQEPLGTVKTRIRSGLGKLRQALAEIWKDR